MEKVNLEADAEGVQISDSALARVATLAADQVRLEEQIAQLNELISELSEQLRNVQEYSLPDAMAAAGVSEFKLLNGAKVTIKPFYSGRIDDTNREPAFDWLRGNGFDDLIKHELVISMGKGNDGLAQQVVDYLQKNKISYIDKEGVHHSTLNAFIKEQVEAGANFPLPTFKAFIGRKAKIKQ